MAQLKSGSTAGGQIIATRDWVTSTLIDGAPAALDTLNELAAAIGDNASYAASITTALAGKLSTTGTAADSSKLGGIAASSYWRSGSNNTWSPSTNILLSQSANSQEWSFDITRNGYTGGYWQVWDSANSTMLKVDAVSGKVSAPYGFVGNLQGNVTGNVTGSAGTAGSATTATTATNLGSNYTADTWFRATGDNKTVKFYGNTRMMVFRTDGEGGDTGHTGYAFKWTYGGDGTSNTRMLLDNNGNLWTSSYGWLHSKFDASGTAQTLVDTAKEELLNGAIATVQTTADNAATTANTALARADGAREDTVAIGELATAAQAAADAAQATANGKLGATAKAADSNLLDGLDSGSFIRSDADDNVSGHTEWQDGKNIRLGNGADFRMWHDGSSTIFRNYNHAAGNMYWQGENTSGTNQGLLYLITDTARTYVKLYENGGEKLRTVSDGIRVYGSARIDGSTNNGRIYADEWGLKIGTDNGHIHFGPANNDWAHIYTDRPAFYTNKAIYENGSRLATQSYAVGQKNAAIAHADSRIDDEILVAIDANITNIARNATDIAGKANAGGSYAQDFAADDMRVDQWFRNTVSGKGLYNDATTQHWYSDSDDYWNIAGGSNQNGIRFRDEHGGTIRGYILANNSNQIGFLDAGGSWAIRHDNDSGTLFYTDGGTLEFRVGRDKVTGNYGTVQTDTTRGGWGGYSIAGRVVFMHDHSNGWGIYNDVNNEWMVYGSLNGSVQLRYNNATKIETNSGGVTVTGTVTATTFSGNATSASSVPWSGVTGKPSTFTPSNHAASKVTSGTFANARISQSSVTQHQGALSIAASQITGLPDPNTPASINGEGGFRIVSVNFNLDRGIIEYQLDNGQVMNGALAR